MRTAAQAVAAAKAALRNRPRQCENFVWTMYGSPRPRTARWASAADAWALSPSRHVGSVALAPVGAIVYLGARPGNAYGDVIIKTGTDQYRASDVGVMGHVGTCTLAEREAMTGRKYVGWMPDCLGNPIDFGTRPASTASTRVKRIEDDMPQRIPHTITRKPQPVEKAWDWLRWNDAGDVSLVVDAGIVSSTVWLQFHGLQVAHQVQARFYRSSPKDPKRDFAYPVVEIVGTAGDTFGQIGGNFELADGDRLRVKLMAFDDGVTVAGGYGSSLVWK